MDRVVSHVGLCVTDLERSRRFYEGLGFTFASNLKPLEGITSKLLKVAEPVGLTAVYLTLDSFVLELLHFDRPENPSFSPRVFNEPGLTHLSMRVSDLEAQLDQVRARGGEVVEESNVGVAVIVRDPDGQLIELLGT